jgi:hypothetical protein
MPGRLETFAVALEERVGDWDSIHALFIEHVRGGFLAGFITKEICTAAQNPAHIVPRGVGQGSFTFLNTRHFEYSVRVIRALDTKPRMVKWTGMPQMIAVTGEGHVVTRTLRVPAGTDIEAFARGVRLREVAVQEVSDSDVIVSDQRREILDIAAVTAPVVAEILTYRYMAPSLVWTFTPDLVSIYAEQSSLAASRFGNVLSIARAAGVPVPDDIYGLALESTSPQVVLAAIQSMLAAGHPESFAALQRAIDSDRESIRTGASELADALFSGK